MELHSLPRRCEIWIGARRPLACKTREVDGCVWLEPVSGLIRVLQPVLRTASRDELAERLVEAMRDPWPGMAPGRPMRVAVDDASWNPSLGVLLAQLGIRRVPLTDASPLEPHLATLGRRCDRHERDGYLCDAGVSPQMVGRLFEEVARLRARRLAGEKPPSLRVDGFQSSPVYGLIDPSEGDFIGVVCVGERAASSLLAGGATQVVFHHPYLMLRYTPLDKLSARMREDIRAHGWPTPPGVAPLLRRTDTDELAGAAEIQLVTDVLEALRLAPAKPPSPFDGPVWLADGRRLRVRFPIDEASALRDSA